LYVYGDRLKNYKYLKKMSRKSNSKHYDAVLPLKWLIIGKVWVKSEGILTGDMLFKLLYLRIWTLDPNFEGHVKFRSQFGHRNLSI